MVTVDTCPNWYVLIAISWLAGTTPTMECSWGWDYGYVKDPNLGPTTLYGPGLDLFWTGESRMGQKGDALISLQHK